MNNNNDSKSTRLLVDKVTGTVIELSDAVIVTVPDVKTWTVAEEAVISGDWGATSLINLAYERGWKVEEV